MNQPCSPSGAVFACVCVWGGGGGPRAWTPTLVKYTRCVPGDLAPAAAHIQRLHARAAEPGAAQRAAYKKYASDRFHAVAAIRSAESPVAV